MSRTKEATVPAPPTRQANHAPILLFAFLAATGLVAYLPEIRAALRAPEVAAPAEIDAKAVAKPDPLDPLAPLPRTTSRAPLPAVPAPKLPGPAIPHPGDGLDDPMSDARGMPRIPGMPGVPAMPGVPGMPAPRSPGGPQ